MSPCRTMRSSCLPFSAILTDTPQKVNRNVKRFASKKPQTECKVMPQKSRPPRVPRGGRHKRRSKKGSSLQAPFRIILRRRAVSPTPCRRNKSYCLQRSNSNLLPSVRPAALSEPPFRFHIPLRYEWNTRPRSAHM